MKLTVLIAALLALLLTGNSSLSIARAQGTAFTYQGRLNNNGQPASGSYDLQFTLFATNVTGAALAGPVTNPAVAVTNGLFTTIVDLGNTFTGASNWLELAVSTNGANTFTTLAPRQQLTPVPYAITAASVSGTIPLAQLPASLITNGAGGVDISGSFSGSGSGLTNLNAAQLLGTLSAAQLPPGVVTNFALCPHIVLYSDALHTFTVCASPQSATNRFTAPNSTTAGMAEIQQMFPPSITNLSRGISITLAGGVYNFTTPIGITNHTFIDGGNPQASIFYYTGPTANFTPDNVISNPFAAALIYVPTNGLLNGAHQQGAAAANIQLQNLMIVPSVDAPCIALLLDCNWACLNNVWILNPVMLTTNIFGPFNGYAQNNDFPNAPGIIAVEMIGSWSGGIVQNCNLEGLADGIVLNMPSGAYFDLHNNLIGPCGHWAGGYGTMYSAGWPTNGACILNLGGAYSLGIHDNLTLYSMTDFAGIAPTAMYNQSCQGFNGYPYRSINSVITAGAGSGSEDIYVGNDAFVNDCLAWGPVLPVPSGSLFVWNALGSDNNWNGNFQFQTDGNGNVTATSFTGNGSGLTSLNAAQLTGTVPAASLPGITTNVSAAGVTFYITNGLIMRVSTP